MRSSVAPTRPLAGIQAHTAGPPPADATMMLAAMLVASSDDAIIGKNLQGLITAWNPAAQRLYGYSAAEVIGNDISILMPPGRSDELVAVLGRVATGAGSQHQETKRIRKDGVVIDVDITISPICDPSGTIMGTSTIARNITERKQTDAVTAEMAAIVDSSNDAIIGKTLQGVITTWNRGAEHVYGYSAPEMIGSNISRLVPPDQPDDFLEMIAGMMANDARTDHFETRRICKDGRLIDVSLTVSPIRDSDGTITGASSVARDITERNSMTVALKASELRNVLAVSRAVAKDELVRLVSHELRTPLASLLGFTELMYSRELTDEQRKLYLGVMLREGRRLTDLINDVLHLQRLDAGHHDLDLAPADVEAIIRRAVAAIGQDTKTPIEVRMPGPIPLVMIDTDAILQVLANFLSNARNYSPRGGAIVVSARTVEGAVEIDVEDHGLGLPADSLPKLFATFYRVDSPDRRLIKGTGLGLAISRKIIEAHGGTVDAHSDGPGRGSRFTMSLPVLVPGSTAADVLIVEDDTGFARLLQEQFHARGLTVVRVADAETAERLLKDGVKPRAVVADLLLPGTQGEEFVARLGQDRLRTFPILVLTVKDLSPADILALEKVGVTAVLPKVGGASEAAVALIALALASKAASA